MSDVSVVLARHCEVREDDFGGDHWLKVCVLRPTPESASFLLEARRLLNGKPEWLPLRAVALAFDVATVRSGRLSGVDESDGRWVFLEGSPPAGGEPSDEVEVSDAGAWAEWRTSDGDVVCVVRLPEWSALESVAAGRPLELGRATLEPPEGGDGDESPSPP